MFLELPPAVAKVLSEPFERCPRPGFANILLEQEHIPKIAAAGSFRFLAREPQAKPLLHFSREIVSDLVLEIPIVLFRIARNANASLNPHAPDALPGRSL
jgi:hypothetical protein